MKKKQLGVIGAVASAAIIASALLVPSANAATRTLTVWADDQRGPQLTTLLQGNTSVVPGYKINIKFFSSLTALQTAWANATAATAPDIYVGAEDVTADAKSGKISPIQWGAKNTDFSIGAINFVSYHGHTYGVPLDVDTTALVYNKAFFPTAPTSLASMIAYYTANKSAKGLTAGLCFPDGVWDSQAFLTAMAVLLTTQTSNSITRRSFQTSASIYTPVVSPTDSSQVMTLAAPTISKQARFHSL